MSLRDAQHQGSPVSLPGQPPYPVDALAPLRGRRFVLPSRDPFVRQTGGIDHAYIDGARIGWVDHPEYMDFLDEDSPVRALKEAEADLYLHHWAGALADVEGATILDVGCGVGRLALPLLRRGAVVHGVDPDHESLVRLAWHASALEPAAGQLDLHWASVHALPDVRADLAVSAEVLCYVPDHRAALHQIAERVRPGGTVLLSVEARWGWATAQDAPPGTLEAALDGDGVVHVEGDRWVRTWEQEPLEAWVRGVGLDVVSIISSHWIPDGPLEDTAPDVLDLDRLLELERRCRIHPVWAPLHRLWLVEAQKPA